jgi:hypothetical protein
MSGSYRTHQATDAIFESLAAPRRRYAVRCLKDYGKPMALADLADEIAALENGAPLTEVSVEAVKQVYLSLYHKHLPTLSSAGIVRYDQNQAMVQLVDDAEQLEQFEDLLEMA